MATFESMDRRMPKIEACLKANGLESLDACNEMLLAKGIDCDKIVRGVQPICFDNAVWAYTLGTAIAVKRGLTDAAECAAAIGEGLEAFTIPGSVAEQRKVGLGHGNLGAMLNFFIGFAFFEAGAFFGFFVAALLNAAHAGQEISIKFEEDDNGTEREHLVGAENCAGTATAAGRD